MEKLVSIIIPIYNAEKYLRECLSSVTKLNYRNKEILLIDDGSVDGSLKICNYFAKENEDIKVIHTENHGVAAARNLGLDNASGKYIFFIDSDDYVKKEYIDELIIKGDEDFVYAGYKELNGEKITKEIIYKNQIILEKDLKQSFEQYWMEVPFLFVRGACFRLSIINNNNIRFDEEIKMGEDTRFNIKYFKRISKIRIADCCNYIYRNNGESIIHNLHMNRLEKERAEVEILEEYAGKELFRIRWCNWHTIIQHYTHHLNNIEEKSTKKKLKKRIKETYKNEYFRETIPYIRKMGSLDEKLETYIMGNNKYWLYPYILKILKKLSRK